MARRPRILSRRVIAVLTGVAMLFVIAPLPRGSARLPLGPAAVGATRRRRLLRDTSAVIVAIGVVLVAGLAILDTNSPSGDVLESTASPRPIVQAEVPTPPAAPATSDATDVAESVAGTAASPIPPTSSPSSTEERATTAPLATAAAPGQTPAPSGSGRRYAVLVACPDRMDCYI